MGHAGKEKLLAKPPQPHQQQSVMSSELENSKFDLHSDVNLADEWVKEFHSMEQGVAAKSDYWNDLQEEWNNIAQ